MRPSESLLFGPAPFFRAALHTESTKSNSPTSHQAAGGPEMLLLTSTWKRLQPGRRTSDGRHILSTPEIHNVLASLVLAVQYLKALTEASPFFFLNRFIFCFPRYQRQCVPGYKFGLGAWHAIFSKRYRVANFCPYTRFYSNYMQ